MKKKYNVGIVGYGGMAGWHEEMVQYFDELELKGIYDIKECRMEAARKKGIYTYNCLEEMLADKEVDLIVVAAPNDVHKTVAISAMKNGKAVICEKPVTLCADDLDEMIKASREMKTFLTVHQNRRWDEDFAVVQRIIQEGKLGDIFRIESRVHGSRGIPGDWRQEKKHGGGMLLDWGVHLLDQIMLIQGEEKCVSVYAEFTNVTNKMVDDGFYAELTFGDDKKFRVEVCTNNFISLPRWYVLGKNGTAVINDWELNGEVVWAEGAEEDVLPVRTAAGLTKTMAPRCQDSIVREPLPKITTDVAEFYRNIIGVLSGEERSRIQLEEVSRVMRLIDVIFEAAEAKAVISCEI